VCGARGSDSRSIRTLSSCSNDTTFSPGIDDDDDDDDDDDSVASFAASARNVRLILLALCLSMDMNSTSSINSDCQPDDDRDGDGCRLGGSAEKTERREGEDEAVAGGVEVDVLN
jgi:hypothetical protein